MPKESDFQLTESPMPHPAGGEVLVREMYLSVDPSIRGRLSGLATFAKSIHTGEVIVGGAVGQVVESNDPRFAPGDIAEGMLGWQEYAVAPAKALRKVDSGSNPITTSLYVLGLPGLTAYFGLLEICHPQPGETVVVSGAAGAVGSLVGQIAKLKRCRVVGIAGSDEKVNFITRELGFDGGFNYKGTPDYHSKLKELCPNGIDVYFDNVGGTITDAVMGLISNRARVAVCGQISQYNAAKPEMGPRWMGQLVMKQARVEGFLVYQFADRFEAALQQLSTWLRQDKIHYREDVVVGLENTPKAFIGVLQGRNMGKQLVKLGV
jgi:NADPH-dependent curcumin reductase CurA